MFRFPQAPGAPALAKDLTQDRVWPGFGPFLQVVCPKASVGESHKSWSVWACLGQEQWTIQQEAGQYLQSPPEGFEAFGGSKYQ